MTTYHNCYTMVTLLESLVFENQSNPEIAVWFRKLEMICPYFLFFTSQKTREPRATCESRSKPDFIQTTVEKPVENYIESRMDRDYNGARRIFLRALGDSPSDPKDLSIASQILNSRI